MPDNIFEYLLHNNHIVKDGYGEWEVGYYYKEMMRSGHPEKYEKDPENGVLAIDGWLIDQGCLDGEKILIKH